MKNYNIIGYAVSIISTISVTFIQVKLQPYFPVTQILLYYPLIVFVTWFSGPGPGVLCTILSSLLTYLYIMLPSDESFAGLVPPGVLLIMGFFLNFVVKNSRVEAEKAVASGKLLENFIEQNPFSMAMFDKEMNHLYTSEKWIQIYQLEGKEVKGKNHYELFPHLPEHWKEAHKKCLKGEHKKCEGEYYEHPDGKRIWVRWEVKPWFDQKGEIGGVIILNEDITEAKKSQETLQRRTNELESLFDNSPVGLAFFDKNLRYLKVNKALADMNGLLQENQVGYTVEEVLPGINKQTQKAIESVFQTGENVIIEVEGETPKVPDVKRCWVTGFYPIRSEKNGVEIVGAYVLETTESKRTQDELRYSEERIRLAQQIAKVGTFEWNIKTNENKWTPELEALYGLKSRTFGGTFDQWREMIHPEDKAGVEAAIESSLKKGHFDKEWRVIWPDGSLHWLAGRGSIESDKDGRPSRMIGINIDITDQKHATEKLRESEERFQMATTATRNAVWDWNLENNIVNWNDAINTEYGHKTSLITLASWWHEHLYKEDRERVFSSIGKAIDDPQQNFWQEEYRFIKGDGSYAIVNDRGFITRNKDGIAIRMTGAMEDITARKQFEKILEESEVAFRATFDLANVGIAHVNREGRWIKVNQFVCDMLGYSEHELKNMSFEELTHPEDVKESLKYDEALRGGKLHYYSIEKRYIRKDGSILWVKLAVSAKLNESRLPEYYIACISDLTSNKLAQANLQEALRARDEFISIASHELKTPITSLKLQSQMFKRAALKNESKLYTKEKVDPMFEQVDKQTVRLNRLVDDMLEVSRIRSGKFSIQKERTDLCEVIEDVVKRMSSQFIEAGIWPPKLKEKNKAIGMWDRMRIEQVLTNLFTNAIRYGDGKEIQIEIKEENGNAHFLVRDKGIGIARENHEKIFDRFERAISANEVSGLGLGLFITKNIVNAHEGKIWVESEPGEGAEFHVLLPLDLNDFASGQESFH